MSESRGIVAAKGIAMHVHSGQSFASPDIGKLVAEEAKKFLTHPLLKPCALVLGTMLIMVTISLSLGYWWDGLWSAR